MGPSATVRHLRHIASQGLPARMAVAAMVDALDELIPTRTKIFIWTDPRGQMRDLYEKEPIPSALDALIAQPAHIAADPEEPTIEKLVNSPEDYGGWRRFTTFARWEKSVLKNEVFRAYNIANNVDFPIREGGAPRAFLALAREPGTPELTRREIATMLDARQHFLHAMNAAEALGGNSSETSDGSLAVVVVRPDLSVSPSDPLATLLLFQLASRDGGTMRIGCQIAPPALAEVARRRRLAESGSNALAPSLDVPTGWGTIRVIAHSLLASGEVVVTLQRLVPRRLRHLRRVAALDLAPREREVAVAMAGDCNADAIARRTGLTTTSYREYARRIYVRLGVEGRAGVRELLDS